MQRFTLTDEFIDIDAERAVLAAIAREPDRYWELVDMLSEDTFAGEGATWQMVSSAIEGEQPAVVPKDWVADPDPLGAARRLVDLAQRRMLAEALETMSTALYSERPAGELVIAVEEAAARARMAVRESELGRIQWGSELLATVVGEALERQQQRVLTGKAITGIGSGLRGLDELLNGFGTGLYVLAGAPGAGKTTLALQFALAAASAGTPAVYVTYENSPTNLVLKALCARASMPARDVERGFADVTKLDAVATEMRPALERLALIEGTAWLTMAQVRAKALQALAHWRGERCLIIVDYLQRAAHAQGYEQLRHNVSALAGELRDIANRLSSPVLALSSQNRAGGNYGEGRGSASLDSLKESGDLEYSADAVLFLRQSEQRSPLPPARAVDLVLAKNRFGDTGSLPLVFRPDLGVIREEARP